MTSTAIPRYERAAIFIFRQLSSRENKSGTKLVEGVRHLFITVSGDDSLADDDDNEVFMLGLLIPVTTDSGER